MDKITCLTDQQEADLQDTKKWWMDHALSCRAMDRQGAVETMTYFYSVIGRKQPMFIFCDSPLATTICPTLFNHAGLTASLQSSLQSSLQDSLHASLWDGIQTSLWNSLQASFRASLQDSLHASLQASLWDSLHASLHASLWDSLHASLQDSLQASLWDSLHASLHASLWDSLHASLQDSLHASLWASLQDSLWGSLWASLQASFRASLKASLQASLDNHWHWGLHSAPWIVFYDFCRRIGVPYSTENNKLLDAHLLYAKSALWCNAYKEVCFISDFPEEIYTAYDDRGNMVCHNDNGMAVRFRDGYGFYALNGVRLSKDIVMTPAEKLDPNLVLSEKNAEVRREIVRKVGIERLVAKLRAKKLDQWEDYELLEITVPNTSFLKARYLKMKNPSIGTYHIEGVPPTIKNIQEALSWRIGGLEWEPNQLT